MKKTILKISGVTLFAVMMLLNIQAFQTESSSSTSFSYLENVAVAQSETGGGGGGICCQQMDRHCYNAGMPFFNAQFISGASTCTGNECTNCGYNN